MLNAESIQKSYPTRRGELNVLRDVTLALGAGEAAAILGPSGSGKSTLLSILGTLETPSAGRVEIDGVDPFGLSPVELARFRNCHIGFVFQDHHLLPPLSALENVLLPTLAGGRAGAWAGADKSGRAGAAMDEPRARAATEGPRARARALLERVGLAERCDHRPAELSGGERQRVAIARALINEPALVLADEPTGDLDRHTAEQVGALLGDLPRERSLVLIVVTHSAALAERFARRYELTDGTLVAC